MSYYGLQINITNLSGNEFLNFFLMAVVEIPGFISSWFLMNKFGRRWVTAMWFLMTGIACILPALGKNLFCFRQWYKNSNLELLKVVCTFWKRLLQLLSTHKCHILCGIWTLLEIFGRPRTLEGFPRGVEENWQGLLRKILLSWKLRFTALERVNRVKTSQKIWNLCIEINCEKRFYKVRATLCIWGKLMVNYIEFKQKYPFLKIEKFFWKLWSFLETNQHYVDCTVDCTVDITVVFNLYYFKHSAQWKVIIVFLHRAQKLQNWGITTAFSHAL